MKTKMCSKCEKEKEFKEFAIDKKKKDGHHSSCKTCHREVLKQHYQNNKEYYAKRRKINRAKTIKWFKEYKATLKCERCGENHPVTLDFHHKDPALKVYQISKISNVSISLLKKEITKCIILCANCHRKLHYEKEK